MSALGIIVLLSIIGVAQFYPIGFLVANEKLPIKALDVSAGIALSILGIWLAIASYHLCMSL